jgi:hypothetical protein
MKVNNDNFKLQKKTFIVSLIGCPSISLSSGRLLQATRQSKGRCTDQWKWYCPSRWRGKYQFKGPYQDPSQGQSVYPDIALINSNYCVYCMEDQHLTQFFSQGIKEPNMNCNCICWYRKVFTRFLDRSISASQYVSRNSEVHVESVQPFIYAINTIY